MNVTFAVATVGAVAVRGLGDIVVAKGTGRMVSYVVAGRLKVVARRLKVLL